MGRCDFQKLFVLWFTKAFILQVLRSGNVIGEQNKVLEVCNLTTKPAALFPLNEHYQGREVIKGNLTVHMSNINFAPGINGEPKGAVEFSGEHNSFIEIEAHNQVKFDQSMTMLLYVYPYKSSTGPLVHYNANLHGVQMWIQGTVDQTWLTARFVRRDKTLPPWLRANVLGLAKWNFIGASYNHLTGWASLFHDGLEVERKFLSKNLFLATDYEIRLGAVAITSLGAYEGAVACLQFYSKALVAEEVMEAKDACKPVIPLEFLSLNLTSPVHIVEANETVLTVNAAINYNASKPTFLFDFGDGTATQESSLSLARHLYHLIGNYNMKVQASTMCNTSLLTANNIISVPKPVKVLTNMSLYSNATVFGERTLFRLFIAQGSDFICLWSLGDNANYTIPRSCSGEMTLTHIYSAPATYTVLVTCRNRRSKVSISAVVHVQKLIRGLRIFPVPPTLFGTHFLVRWQIDNGTDVEYKANFSGVLLKIVKSYDELHGEAWVNQSHYKTHGEFFLSVAASNAITKWIYARIQCVILRSVIPFSPIVFHRAKDVEINETVSISFTDVNSVPEINASYIVTFRDNSEVLITSKTLVNLSFNHYGIFTVNITADNGVSTFNTSVVIQVHKPVLRLHGAIIPHFAAKVDENVNVTMFLLIGSDFDCQWHFGDGSEPFFQTLNDVLVYFKHYDLNVDGFRNLSISTSHVYKGIGVYNVSTICKNRLSEAKAIAFATVQDEITLFKVPKVPPVIFGREFVVNFTIASGTNVTFTVFLNQKELNIERRNMYYSSNVTPEIYGQPGKHNFTVTAENLVTSLLRQTQIVFIEIKASGVHISMGYFEGNILRSGHGVDRNVFPEKTPVVLQVSTDNGTNLNYTWSVTGANSSWTNKTVTHTFDVAGVYVVSLRVENHVSTVNTVKRIAIQKSASFKKDKGRPVKCTSPKVRNEAVTVEAVIETLGTNSTLRILMDNTTSYWYGDFAKFQEFKKKEINNTSKYKGKLQKSIELHHVYNTPGKYSILAILGNEVSTSLQTCEIEILSRPCKNPDVKLKDIGDNRDDAPSFLTIDNINIAADVDVFCPESRGSKYEWKIFKENPETGLFEYVSNPHLNKGASMLELLLKRRSLPIGLFKLTLTVGMVERELKNFIAAAEGFIKVVKSPLAAQIIGGSEVRRGFGSMLTIDGFNSFDPDVGPGNHSGMQFLWFCRNVSENFPKLILDVINGSVVMDGDNSVTFYTQDGEGCYRDGYYLLSTTTFLELKTSQMMQHETYVIVLVVRKDQRMSSTTQKLELGPKDLPTLSLRCEVNCGAKVNPSDKLSVSTKCKGTSCTNDLVYSWWLFILDSRKGTVEPTWQRDNTTLPRQENTSQISYPNLIIKRNLLQGDHKYMLVVTATLPDGNYGRASYEFQVNSAPKSGTCDVEPRIGHVLSQEYKFWCTGWYDPDGPLSYEIVHVHGIMESMFYYGREANATISLPLGEEIDNYTMNITVRVSDKFGSATIVSLQVQSLPALVSGKELMSQMSSMMNSGGSSLDSLVKSGKYQDVGRIVGSISSILNHQVKTAGGEDASSLTEERKQMRESLVKAITGQTVTSQKSAKLISSSLNQVTQVKDEVSLAAQEAGTSALTNMATFLERESQEPGSSSVDSVAADMCGSIGNLLGAASDVAAVNQPNKTNVTSPNKDQVQSGNQDKRTKGKSVVKQLFTALNSVSKSVLRRKVAFEDATEISTPRLTLNLKSFSPSEAGGEVSSDSANFKLPSGNDMFGGGKAGIRSVNRKVASMPQNYYTYDESSKDVKSPVVSLSFEDKDNEKSITVSNLKQQVEYFLPGPEKLPEPDKFSSNGTENAQWTYHKITVTSEDEAVSIEIAPFNCSHKLQVYVREKVQPTRNAYTWTKVIWNPSSDNWTIANYTRCFEEYTAYTLFISNKDLRASTYIVGILYENERKDHNETVLMKYSMRVYKTKCLYWNEEIEKWSGDGCAVGPLTSPSRIHCMTNHLTSFGSGMFVAPNPIDFSKALAGFKNAFETGNVVVMFTILFLLLLYALLAIWAWRTDRKDAMQIGATLIHYHQDSDYRYEIYFVTGSRNGSGTTAHVGCEILGEEESSGPCYLLDTSRALFRRGDLNVFILSLPNPLGPIRGLRVWHDNDGKSPGWFLNRAMLRDCQTGDKWIFLSGRWLDVAEEDGKINVLFRPANDNDMVSFKKVFNTKLRKGICDNHLWFSVAYRPPRSPFTRLQRLSCCLSLLFSFMVATAMFFGATPQPGDSSDDFQIGPLKLNMRTLIIGIESALIVIPVNVLIVALFRNSRAKEINNSKADKDRCDDLSSQTSANSTESDSVIDEKDISLQCFDQETDANYVHCIIGGDDSGGGLVDENRGRSVETLPHPDVEICDNDCECVEETQKPGVLAKIRAKFQGSGRSSAPCFPYWCVYVGWCLCILTTLTSAVFTLFYSMMWGREQSNLWLTTMLISFVQDTLISQPLKVLVLSVIFATLIKSADGEDDLEEVTADAGASDELVRQDLTNEDFSHYDPPDKERVKSLRAKELRRRQIIKLFTDLCVYVILLAMVIILSFQYRNPDSYKMIDTLRRIFVNPIHNNSRVRLDEVNTKESIWDWVRKTMLPELHSPSSYSGVETSDPFIGDRMSLQLGVIRLRQIRVRRGTCDVNEWFKGSFLECNSFYSQANEETKLFSPGWENGRDKPEDNDNANMLRFLTSKSKNAFTSWEYMNAFEARHMLPIIGIFATYRGGGYVFPLNDSLEDANMIVDHQQASSWLDTYTRAVHAEFVAYNPTINMVAAATITFELPPLGGVFKSYEIYAVNMYSSLRKHPVARIIGEVITAILLVVMLVRVGLTIFHDKLGYFKDLSKVLDLVLVLTGVVIVFLRMLKEGFKKLARDQFNEDPHQFLDFHQCGFYDELTDYAFAFLNFIAIVRFSVFLQFLSCLDRILRTIARSFYELLACLFVFLCLMMAFSSLFKLAFNTDSEDFKDFSSSLQTSMSYMARMIRSSDQDASSSYTAVRALALFSCCLTLIFFYFTVIRSIFIVGYRHILAEDRGKENEKSFEAGIFEIFVDKFMEVAGMEKEVETIVKEEEEDPEEVRLRAQRNYIDKSQFFRLRNLINEAYTDDFADDVRLFDLMSSVRDTMPQDTADLKHNELKPGRDNNAGRIDSRTLFTPLCFVHEVGASSTNDLIQNKSDSNKLQDRNANSINEEMPTLNRKLPDTHSEGERADAQVRFDLPPRKNNEEMSHKKLDATPPESNEQEKLKLLEQLVQEKMKALESKVKVSSTASVEHEMKMLEKLKQRIDAKKRE